MEPHLGQLIKPWDYLTRILISPWFVATMAQCREIGELPIEQGSSQVFSHAETPGWTFRNSQSLFIFCLDRRVSASLDLLYGVWKQHWSSQ